MCISYYQIARSLDVPYEVAKRLLRAGLQGGECSTTTGALGVREADLQRFKKQFRIVQTESGRWLLKPSKQLKLF